MGAHCPAYLQNNRVVIRHHARRIWLKIRQVSPVILILNSCKNKFALPEVKIHGIIPFILLIVIGQLGVAYSGAGCKSCIQLVLNGGIKSNASDTAGMFPAVTV